jgi:uncharacterized repeat protein (TIGR03803 family)
LAPGAWAQSKYKTLYKFTGGKDGWAPEGLIFDAARNLYGMTHGGGASGNGVVFELTPNADGSWKEKVLHDFNGKDGNDPWAGLIFDQAGNLYGTTNAGGNPGPGVVFELTPNPDGSWTESVLHTFCSLTNCDDGRYAEAGLIFDSAGNLYGTTVQGGGSPYCGGGCGVVYQLTPNADGSWKESVLHSFHRGGKDGDSPTTGSLIFDQAGNLYGTTAWGGGRGNCPFGGCGIVFGLTPNTDGSWKENVLHRFTGNDGAQLWGGLILDPVGNLYGTAVQGGNLGQCNGGCGVVFKLTPNVDGSWRETVLHRFTGGRDGAVLYGGLIFDQAGNLYGTTYQGGNLSYCNGAGCGVVFKLSPNSNGGWKETVLHVFVDHPAAEPGAGVIFDTVGNLYGTTQGDGATTFGSVFEITP